MNLKSFGTVKLVSFGRGGHSEYHEPTADSSQHVQGYDSPENWKPDAGVDYSDCIVVDVRAAVETKEGRSWVFKGPLLDLRLSDGQVDACPEPSAMFAEAVSGNQFGAMLSMRKVGGLSLDSVSRSEYVKGWRLHGARIGRVADGAIAWENAPKSVPPPAAAQPELFA